MEYEKLLEIVGDEAVFESGLLLAGSEDPLNVYRQRNNPRLVNSPEVRKKLHPPQR